VGRSGKGVTEFVFDFFDGDEEEEKVEARDEFMLAWLWVEG